MIVKRYPKVYTKRTVIRFAWLPKIIGELGYKEKLIWLQGYKSFEEYRWNYFSFFNYWRVIKTELL